MIELTLVGVGCQKCWELEDKIIRLSREIGVPVQIRKVMDLDQILGMNLETIPAIMVGTHVWPYEKASADGQLRQLLIGMNDTALPAGA